MKISHIIGILAVVALGLAACGGGASNSGGTPPASTPVELTPAQACSGEATLDDQLRCMLQVAKIAPIESAPSIPDPLYNAGNLLFNSTLLSGTGTVSCASCHPTNNAGMDKLALHASLRGSPNPIHRNTPDLVNKLLGEKIPHVGRPYRRQ